MDMYGINILFRTIKGEVSLPPKFYVRMALLGCLVLY